MGGGPGRARGGTGRARGACGHGEPASEAEQAGYAVLCWGYSLESGGREAVLDEVFVRAGDRGRGLGAAALPELLDACRAAGILRVFLETEEPNDGARRFYRRHGFQEETSIWMTRGLWPAACYPCRRRPIRRPRTGEPCAGPGAPCSPAVNCPIDCVVRHARPAKPPPWRQTGSPRLTGRPGSAQPDPGANETSPAGRDRRPAGLGRNERA